MPSIKVTGLEELQKCLKENATLNDVKKVIKHHGAELQSRAQDKADFRGHYEGKKFVPPTGNLKRSIGLEIIDGGFTAEVEPTAEYAGYVELGTRFMEAQPYLKPAFEEQKKQFESDMQKLAR